MYKFVLMRHGRSVADDEMKHEGRFDSELTENGVAQAKGTTELLLKSNYSFRAIITSPLKRALRTAEIINENYKVEIIKNELLMEQDNGILAGQNKKDALMKYPMPSFYSPFRYFPENSGENEIMLHARGGLAVNSLIRIDPGQYLIIGHGGILNAMIRNMLGINLKSNGSGVTFLLRDNGYIDIDYDENKNHWIIRNMSEGNK